MNSNDRRLHFSRVNLQLFCFRKMQEARPTFFLHQISLMPRDVLKYAPQTFDCIFVVVIENDDMNRSMGFQDSINTSIRLYMACMWGGRTFIYNCLVIFYGQTLNGFSQYFVSQIKINSFFPLWAELEKPQNAPCKK